MVQRLSDQSRRATDCLYIAELPNTRTEIQSLDPPPPSRESPRANTKLPKGQVFSVGILGIDKLCKRIESRWFPFRTEQAQMPDNSLLFLKLLTCSSRHIPTTTLLVYTSQTQTEFRLGQPWNFSALQGRAYSPTSNSSLLPSFLPSVCPSFLFPSLPLILSLFDPKAQHRPMHHSAEQLRCHSVISHILSRLPPSHLVLLCNVCIISRITKMTA